MRVKRTRARMSKLFILGAIYGLLEMLAISLWVDVRERRGNELFVVRREDLRRG